MTAWWEGTLATLDTETTGTDPEQDRMVTGCLDIYGPSNDLDLSLRTVVNPGILIPAAATEVHGYTTEKVQEIGADPVEALLQIEQGLQHVAQYKIPLVIYNAPYDLTLLDREFRRHLQRPLPLAYPVIDPMVLDKHVDRYVSGSGQRKLEPTARRYGVEVDDWHTADADAYAAMAIARRMGEKYEQTLPADLRELWRLQVRLKQGQAADLQNYFARVGKTNDDGTPILIDGQWPMIAHA